MPSTSISKKRSLVQPQSFNFHIWTSFCFSTSWLCQIFIFVSLSSTSVHRWVKNFLSFKLIDSLLQGYECCSSVSYLRFIFFFLYFWKFRSTREYIFWLHRTNVMLITSMFHTMCWFVNGFSLPYILGQHDLSKNIFLVNNFIGSLAIN